MEDLALRTEDIVHGYERTRLNNKLLLQERRLTIYAKIPRIEELEEQATNYHIEVAKKRALGLDKDRTLTNSMQKKVLEINAEKSELLKNAGYPTDFLEPIYRCSKCKDTGYVENTDEKGEGAPLVKRCTCYTKQLIECLYTQSNLNNVFKKENFDTFDLSYYGTEKKDWSYSPRENIENILKKSHDFIEQFEKKRSQRGNILIYGEVGIGKTFLTNCIAKEILDNGHSVLYLTANELFEGILGNHINKERKSDVEALYNYVYGCELLIIDDLGTEYPTDFGCTYLFAIINQRGIAGKSTLISTNHTMKQLREKYSERVTSRIVEDYAVFNIYGDNIRYQKRKKAINLIT